MTDVPEGFKRCSRGENCVAEGGAIQPATNEFFNRNRSSKDGLGDWCKACLARYYEEHREPLLQYRAQYYASHAGEINAKRREERDEDVRRKEREYRNKNKLRKREQARSRYRNNSDERRQYNRRAYQTKPEYFRERARVYSRSPEGRLVDRLAKIRRRARKRGLANTFTTNDWFRALEYFEYRCAYCLDLPEQGSVLEADHFIPLASRNCPGTVPGNMVPACKSCNSSKSHRSAKRWLTERFSPFYALIALRRIRDYFEWLKSQDKGAP